PSPPTRILRRSWQSTLDTFPLNPRLQVVLWYPDCPSETDMWQIAALDERVDGRWRDREAIRDLGDAKESHGPSRASNSRSSSARIRIPAPGPTWKACRWPARYQRRIVAGLTRARSAASFTVSTSRRSLTTVLPSARQGTRVARVG